MQQPLVVLLVLLQEVQLQQGLQLQVSQSQTSLMHIALAVLLWPGQISPAQEQPALAQSDMAKQPAVELAARPGVSAAKHQGMLAKHQGALIATVALVAAKHLEALAANTEVLLDTA